MSKSRRFLVSLAAGCLLAGPGWAQRSDLLPPQRRIPAVELAQRLAEPTPPPPLPADLIQPFNPVAFGQPDPEELRAQAAAAARAAATNAATKPATDRDFLDLIASRIAPSGTLMVGGESWLVFGQKRVRPGDHFTVSYEGSDYDLELVAVDRTSFTLRLNQEEITRPIKTGK
ncbi:MAG TPA: hypothetical protein VG710_07335 [Opitutus sp.]|nr:hypothetical protein [Opitutus sp.]